MTSSIALARAQSPWGSNPGSTRVYHALAQAAPDAAALLVKDPAWHALVSLTQGKTLSRLQNFPAPCAMDVYRRMLPELGTCYFTLAALEASSPSPVHADDAQRLLRTFSVSVRTYLGVRPEPELLTPALHALMRSWSMACSQTHPEKAPVRLVTPFTAVARTAG